MSFSAACRCQRSWMRERTPVPVGGSEKSTSRPSVHTKGYFYSIFICERDFDRLFMAYTDLVMAIL